MNLLGNWQLQLTLLATVAFAMLLGGCIGFEREISQRPAGMRTHMLIGGAAALLLGIGDLLAEHFSEETYSQLIRADPIRIIGAVVTAVAFIGAGTIIQHARHNSVLGLTTAASLLLTASIGIAVGLRQYILAIGVTFLALVVLHWLPKPKDTDS
ncbi:MgtC/SapB family protein [Nitrosomonas communis]|uniref:Protein MgtC n=1 Tax=Nitrosomonas communis TaxID=44574 RepID=A0A1H2YQC6_9PROT|nr:MgtC/SapB family protein [Nitrosomonas communis]SDX07443.1 putative Mg2+ transporter-C (MgtC) family protein [Nitrosomonas communis]